MGYWNQSADGVSFAGDGSLLWGDAPADCFDEGLSELAQGNVSAEVAERTLIGAIDGELNSFSSFLAQAKECFAEDVGREPNRDELIGGVRFSMTTYR